MGVIAVRPIDGGSGEEMQPIYIGSAVTSNTTGNAVYQKKYTRNYFVECKEADPATTILDAGNNGFDLPNIDDADVDDPDSFCVRRSARQENLKAWTVACEFETWNDPTLEDADWTCDPAESTEILISDKDGAAILSSAKIPLVPGIDITYSEPVISVKVARDSIDLNALLALTDAANSDAWVTPFGTFPQYSAKCNLPKVVRKKKKKGGAFYFEIMFTVKIRWKLWYPWKVLDASLYELVGTVQKPIRDRNGMPITQPVPITGGLRIDPTTLPGAAAYLSFNVYRTTSFASVPPS